MKVKLIEPISRKLNILGRAYLTVLGNHMEHLDINRYYYPLTVICFYDGQLTQKALAEKLGKDKSVIVKIIDSLTEKGFVYRQINPEDRRQHLLGVTEKAKKAVPYIIQVFESMNQSASKNISEHDMQIFESVLNKMRDNLVDFKNKEFIANSI
ncbi:MarR family winged helix-turn-helix transcriptional regulator [Mucilaginibacter sp. UR6-11]|uniref:MarR family winged helix-turn-helix transcriptional regulator n=1 Tax=Mucilaginibacter sp. UR6-11 TaxID=1435644 RepID=UPI001E371168|nr:MarR family transcriptional regulator [Mucilaginibacter sp. UR6-11]MCC8426573.1 MarR family transcriptional regulator [Mucilaginibacter sp. UR6-11]